MSTANTLKAALESYRKALNSMTTDEWNEILSDLDFNPEDPAWPEWDEKNDGIREEMDFIDSLKDDDNAVYITLSYVDDNDMNKVTGITATDGNGDVLLDMNFIIPVDLEKPILDEIREEM